MNAGQSNATQAVNNSKSKNNYPTDNPVAQTMQNGATISGQETENVSETSSAKQRPDEGMKNFDIEFETKIQLEQAAWSILEKNFGRAYMIIDAHLESLRKANLVKPRDSTGLINCSIIIVLNFFNVLKEVKHIGNLQSSSTLYMTVDKQPQVLKEMWWFYDDDKDEDWPDLSMSEKKLSKIAFVH